MDHRSRREIEQDCRDLVVALAQCGDHREFALAVGLYAEECEWLRMGTLYVGRASIKDAYESLPRARVVRHMTGGTVVDVIDQDHAQGLTYYVSFAHEGQIEEKCALPLPLICPVSMGEWRDEFVRTPEGWRFERRVTTRIFERTDDC